MLPLPSWRHWNLFLDRDGVINERLPGDYVRDWSEFRFLPGALESLAFFATYFGPIVVVTNQQGIGKGLMTKAELTVIHNYMLRDIRHAGGRVDAVYFCPDQSSTPGNCRKPNPAMAHWAQRDFPEIDFTRSVIIGDSAGDMEFGFRLGMSTVLVEGKEEDAGKLSLIRGRIDHCIANLPEIVALLKP